MSRLKQQVGGHTAVDSARHRQHYSRHRRPRAPIRRLPTRTPVVSLEASSARGKRATRAAGFPCRGLDRYIRHNVGPASQPLTLHAIERLVAAQGKQVKRTRGRSRSFFETHTPRVAGMESEIVDLAENLQERIVNLRDSL
jgi:hypothetical protein